MKPRLFISYRRRENEWAVGHVRDRLSAEFGPDNVFFDTEAMEAGEEIRKRISGEIERCSAVVMVYGKAWAGRGPNGRRRIDDPDDLVRFELAEAHRQGKRIVPVVIDEEPPPKPEHLPPDLRFLPDLNFVKLRATDSLDRQIGRLTMDIRNAVFGLTKAAHYLAQASWIALWSAALVWLLRDAGALTFIDDGFARVVQAIALPASRAEPPAVVEISQDEHIEIFGGRTPLDPQVLAIFVDGLRERSHEARRCDKQEPPAPIGVNIDLLPGDDSHLVELITALRRLADCRPLVVACPQRVAAGSATARDREWMRRLSAPAAGGESPVHFASTQVDPGLLRHSAARTEIGAVMADLADRMPIDWSTPQRECACPATEGAAARCSDSKAAARTSEWDQRSVIVPYALLDIGSSGTMSRAVLPGSTVAARRQIVIGAGYGVQGRYSVPPSRDSAVLTQPVSGAMAQAFVARAASVRPRQPPRWAAATVDLGVAFVTSSILMKLWTLIAINALHFSLRVLNYLGVLAVLIGVPVACVAVAGQFPAVLALTGSVLVVVVVTWLRSAMSGYEVLLNGGVGWKFLPAAWAALSVDPRRGSARVRFLVLCIEALVILAGLYVWLVR